MKSIVVLVYSIFLNSLLEHVVYTSTPELSELEIFRTYCPGIKTCTERENDTEADLDIGLSCCQTCTCDAGCWDRGNCCPDAPYPYRPRTVACVEKKSNYNYFITDKCQVGHSAIEMLICEGEDDPRLFRDAGLVSDSNNSRVFRNRFCAECNGVTNYVPWKIASLSQRNNHCIDTRNELPNNISKFEDCGIISVRPNEEIHNNAVCHRENIVTLTDCHPSSNSTLQWYYERCLRYRIPAFFNNNINNNSRIYRNIYCYLCNSIKKNIPPQLCAGQGIGLFPGTRLIQATVPFTKIFNFIDSDGDSELTKCDDDQLYDEYKKRCLTFSCGFGYIKQSRMCKRNMIESSNVQFRIQVEFIPTADKPYMLTSPAVGAYIAEAKRAITSIHPCQFANEAAWSYTDERNVDIILWQFEIYTSYNCQDWDIKDIIDYLGNEEVVIKDETFSNTSAFSIKPVYFNSHTPSEALKTNVSVDTSAIEFDHEKINVDEVTFCTSVSLSESMLADLVNDISNNQKDNYNPVSGIELKKHLAYKDGAYNICYDRYVDITKSLKSAGSLKAPTTSGFLSMACTFVSIICAGFTVVVNIVFDGSYSLPKYIMYLVCINLILAQSMFQFGIGAVVSGPPCISIGIFIHAFWLSHTMSMNAFVYGVVFTLRKGVNRSSFSYSKLLVHVVYIYFTPFIFVALNIGISKLTTEKSDIGYGEGPDKLCYISTAFSRLIYFVAPIFIIVFLNMCGYIYFVWFMIKQRIDSEVLQSQRLYIQAYDRLSCVTGITWFFGLLSEFLRTEVFEYLFVLTNCGQGVFLFLAFGRIRNIYSSIKSRALVSTTSMADSKDNE